MKRSPTPIATVFAISLCATILNVSAHNDGTTCVGGKGHAPETELTKARAAESAVGILAVSKPSIITRTQWGCPDGQDSPQWPAQYTTVSHLIVHHSGTPNTDTDWAARVRQILYYHRDSNGWGDIGYNYLIDPNGVIYEGRAGGDNVIGAHFSCMNGGTMGVCLLGTYEYVQPTQAAIESLENLLAWKCDQRNLNPLGGCIPLELPIDSLPDLWAPRRQFFVGRLPQWNTMSRNTTVRQTLRHPYSRRWHCQRHRRR